MGFAAWSPYQNMGVGYAEAWGPRQPTWEHVTDIAGYSYGQAVATG
ncbi:MAG TPA: hypothetical protein VH372_19190 [Actinospica sp.]|nr:hypothetical protein [Actinospica sp.]